MQSHYERIGGEAKIRALTERFYEYMDTLPEAYGIRKLHPKDLSHSIQKLYEFLVGWMGGPPLYVEKYGHPMLRRRHLPFPIGQTERDQWLYCMRKALDDTIEDPGLREELFAAFVKVAEHMRNQDE